MVSAVLITIVRIGWVSLAGSNEDRAMAAEMINGPNVIGAYYAAVFNGDLRDLPQFDGGDPVGQVLPAPMKGDKALPAAAPGRVDPLAQTRFGDGKMPDPILWMAIIWS